MNRARFVALCSLVAWTAGCGGGKSSTTPTPPAKSWSAPATLQDGISPEGKDARLPQVAMDDHGNAIVAWYEKDAADDGQVYLSEYRNGAWKHPASLADSISLKGQDAGFPSVAMGNDGDAIVVWRQSDGVDARIYRSEYRNGHWTHPAGFSDCIDVPGGINAQQPVVAMDDHGNAIIAWGVNDGAHWGVYKAEYRNGAWTYPASLADRLSIATTSMWSTPRVAMDNVGNALVAWVQDDASVPPVMQIYKADYRGGAWIKPANLSEHISPGAPHNVDVSAIAMADNGEAVIVWSGVDGSSNWQAYRSEYRAGKWSHATGLDDRTSLPGQATTGSAVAMDAGGNTVLAWSEYDGSSLHVYKREYRGGQWTAPSGFGDHLDLAAQASRYPSVAMSDGGGALVAWVGATGADVQLYKSEYRGGRWSTPSSVADHLSVAGSNVDGFAPGVAMDASGNAVVAWAQGDGTSWRVFLGEYR